MEGTEQQNLVLIIVVSIITLAVGAFIITTFVTSGGVESSSVEYFSVADPSSDLTVSLKYTPAATPTVTQYNGIEWVSVDSTYISYMGTQLTVAAGGMQG